MYHMLVRILSILAPSIVDVLPRHKRGTIGSSREELSGCVDLPPGPFLARATAASCWASSNYLMLGFSVPSCSWRMKDLPFDHHGDRQMKRGPHGHEREVRQDVHNIRRGLEKS